MEMRDKVRVRVLLHVPWVAVLIQRNILSLVVAQPVAKEVLAPDGL